MLLQELFQQLPEDYGQLTSANIPSFDPRYSKVVGQFDSHDIWESREVPNYDIFGIRDINGDVLSICRISSNVINGVYVLSELWTRQDKRGQGLATILILFVLRKLHIKLWLAPDEILSDDSRAILIKGLNANKFKAYDIDGSLLTADQYTEIFQKLGKTDDQLILAESKLNFEVFSDRKIGSGSSYLFVEQDKGFD